MQVRDIMTPDPVVCVPSTTLRDVAKLMVDTDCGAIPVVENERNMKLIGIVTDRDITCRMVAKGINPVDRAAEECMSQPCITVRFDEDVEDLFTLLEDNQIRRIPVVDEDGRCIGMISQADIALEASEEEAAEVLREVSQPGASATL